MAMARIVCLLLFLAIVNYDHFDAPTDSIVQPFVSVDGKRMSPKKSTFIGSRKLLDEPESECEVSKVCDPMKAGECPGNLCSCEEIRDNYWACLEFHDICLGKETCQNHGDCVGDCTCEEFFNPDGSKSKECEIPSDYDADSSDESDDSF